MLSTSFDIVWSSVVGISLLFIIGAGFVVSLITGQRRHIKSQQDVLAKLRAEVNERTRAEEKYRGIFENAVEGIFQLSPQGDLLSSNPAAAHILGFSSISEFEGSPGSNASPFLGGQVGRREFYSRLECQEAIKNHEVETQTKDGKNICVSINAHIVRDAGGKAIYCEGTIEDISSRKENEQLRLDSARRVFEAQEAERKRVAFELHDSISQMLSSVRFRLKSAEEKAHTRKGPSLQSTRESRELVEKTISELRRISRNLRPWITLASPLQSALHATISHFGLEWACTSIQKYPNGFPATSKSHCIALYKRRSTTLRSIPKLPKLTSRW
jgi:PAS domain S-box-containing protein